MDSSPDLWTSVVQAAVYRVGNKQDLNGSTQSVNLVPDRKHMKCIVNKSTRDPSIVAYGFEGANVRVEPIEDILGRKAAALLRWGDSTSATGMHRVMQYDDDSNQTEPQAEARDHESFIVHVMQQHSANIDGNRATTVLMPRPPSAMHVWDYIASESANGKANAAKFQMRRCYSTTLLSMFIQSLPVEQRPDLSPSSPDVDAKVYAKRVGKFVGEWLSKMITLVKNSGVISSDMIDSKCIVTSVHPKRYRTLHQQGLEFCMEYTGSGMSYADGDETDDEDASEREVDTRHYRIPLLSEDGKHFNKQAYCLITQPQTWMANLNHEQLLIYMLYIVEQCLYRKQKSADQVYATMESFMQVDDPDMRMVETVRDYMQHMRATPNPQVRAREMADSVKVIVDRVGETSGTSFSGEYLSIMREPAFFQAMADTVVTFVTSCDDPIAHKNCIHAKKLSFIMESNDDEDAEGPDSGSDSDSDAGYGTGMNTDEEEQEDLNESDEGGIKGARRLYGRPSGGNMNKRMESAGRRFVRESILRDIERNREETLEEEKATTMDSKIRFMMFIEHWRTQLRGSWATDEREIRDVVKEVHQSAKLRANLKRNVQYALEKVDPKTPSDDDDKRIFFRVPVQLYRKLTKLSLVHRVSPLDIMTTDSRNWMRVSFTQPDKLQKAPEQPATYASDGSIKHPAVLGRSTPCRSASHLTVRKCRIVDTDHMVLLRNKVEEQLSRR